MSNGNLSEGERGGARKNAGRHAIPEEDKKVSLSVSVSPGVIPTLNKIVFYENQAIFEKKKKGPKAKAISRGHIVESALKKTYPKYYGPKS